MKTIAATLTAGVAGLALASAASAQELSVVGSWSGLSLHQNFEQPFWSEMLPAAAGVDVELTTFDQMGIAGSDVYRMLENGVFDIGATVVDYTVQDAPELEGLDMPVIAPDVDDARAVAEAYRELLNEAMGERFNARVLAIVPYPQQVVFCNTEIGGLADLEGLQIRASGRTTAEFIQAIGGTGITLAFNEVPGALDRGVVDCAITGSLSGYSSGWHEVSTHLLPLPVGGWDHVVTAINLDTWNGLSADTQAAIDNEIRTGFEVPVWETAVDETVEGVACLTGNGTCGRGDAGSMVLVEATEADLETARAALTSSVLPAWVERVGPEWVGRWNETVGAVAGIQAPLE